MKFGPVPVAEALGRLAGHSVQVGGRVIRKGTRFDEAHIAALHSDGVETVIAAEMEPGDLPEDLAAARLAAALAGPGTRAADAFTGRANLHALHAGLLRLAPPAVDAFNLVHESITLATLPAFSPVAAGDMVATVKIIPFAVQEDVVAEALSQGQGLLDVAPFRRQRVALVSTLLPGLAPKVLDKTRRVTAERLARLEARLVCDLRVPHDPAALSAALAEASACGADCILVFGASAIADRRDVIPVALEQAGGRVERLGMPVDPGNLLMLGWLADIPVLGAPGCARSPKENGFDWVLARVLADIPVTGADIARLGVGGLLGEIPTRPQPRDEPPAESPAAIAAVILAAGRGTRMADQNKLLAEVGGRPVVRRVAEAALASAARPVVVVTGHDRARIEAALAGLPVMFMHNERYQDGMAGSVRTGIAAVPRDAGGAILLLGDMPLVSADLIDAEIAAFGPERGRLIVVPVRNGARGNPVLWSRRFFPDLCALEGDVGARHLIAAHGEAVCEVEAEGPGAFLDVDTPEALAEVRQASDPRFREA
ncbi:molybdopterin-binding/glycosyltransferase family 2 protein [Aquabacter sediminis]|uniref:molybdopterin-binding/glycosyltransferase family 2 protein n=1 Tax=Aquabacter sediminis TaxID=3029197 RepID=UPI00237EE100|nr:molybdopterin-binding/glycosyltransferase family 2 protein [Aquabacter sp. P-9]MDE1566794.1 molybdopterin-binding/glycosyltransferase family 2 protein [Aquabacter sp. P-9]